MLSTNKKSNLTMIVYLTIHVLAASLFFGCDQRKSFYDANREDINLVPYQIENPDQPILENSSPEIAVDNETTEPELKVEVKVKVEEKAEDTAKPETKKQDVVVVEAAPKVKPAPVRPTKPAKPAAPEVKKNTNEEASRFIKIAFWVIQNEARKIGTPCNFYVSRVLELAGYSKDDFLANDFDIYARKNFSSYKNEIFMTSNIESERARLKRHIWSYPARTPFIFQWERSRPKAGHIAIVERIGDKLVIYQASLNRHIARREQTTVDRLLTPNRSNRMTVYSEFIAK